MIKDLLANGEVPDSIFSSDYVQSLIPTPYGESDPVLQFDPKLWAEEQFQLRLEASNENSTIRGALIGLLQENSRSANIIRYSTNRIIEGQLRNTGGFADRMKGVVTAALLSAAIGFRFEIEWDSPVEIQALYSPNDVDWQKSDSASQSRIDLVDNIQVIQPDMTSDELIDLLGIVEGVNRLHSNSISTNLLTSPVLSNALGLDSKSMNRFPPYHAILSLFHYTPHDYEARLAALFQLLQSGKKKSIAIHFRTGGDGSWRDPRIDDPENLTKLVEFSLASSGISSFDDGLIFFCSDSELVKTRVHEKYSQFDIVTLGLGIGHTDPNRTKTMDDAATGFRSAVLESHLISLCGEIYCGKGGYALLSAVRAGLQIHRYYSKDLLDGGNPFS